MAEKKEKKPSAWLSRIGDRETAFGMARETAIAMLFWAAVQAAFSFKYGPSLVVHAAILAVGGLWLLRWKSRAAAVVLSLYALANACITLAINSGVPLEGGGNLAFALIIAWTGLKAVEATFRLRGRFAFDSESSSAPALQSRPSSDR